ncbi:uncharacterized protein LOC123396230 [Hordeum vulgare subsp. vulgare]|uniref:uncharacterized protein LOC123396230 n=1 Tax=Hordeum vulgare subsp. vulgare TaxID=112509 RepID=UPI001D1A57B7|nr:uncharacterized protein LOC123396230 [Hordeum vulgare subsp. vulgare]
MKTMASSASLLHPSTLAPASPRPLRRCGLAPPQLGLQSSPRRPRGVSLTVAAAASPEVQKEPSSSPPPPPEEPSALSAVAESVKVLKDAAKTRKVPAPEVLAALAKIKKAKLDTSTFFEMLGGAESPGRTWMLIFTAKVSRAGSPRGSSCSVRSSPRRILAQAARCARPRAGSMSPMRSSSPRRTKPLRPPPRRKRRTKILLLYALTNSVETTDTGEQIV